MNAANVKRYLKHYFYGLFAKSLNGAFSAADAAVGLAAGAMVESSIDFPTWKGVLAIFITSFFRNALAYFKEHPFPEKIETVPPMPVQPTSQS